MPARDDEVQALVEQLSAELNRSVLVDDAGLRLLAYSPTQGSDDDVRKTAILMRETPRAIRDLHFSQGIATATEAVRTAPRPEFGLQSRVCVPIRCQGVLFGYLWLIDADESLTGEDCELAERCAAEIGTAMYRRRSWRSRAASWSGARWTRCSAPTPPSASTRRRSSSERTCWWPGAWACSRSAPATGLGAGAGREGAPRARARPVPARAARPPVAQRRARRPRARARRPGRPCAARRRPAGGRPARPGGDGPGIDVSSATPSRASTWPTRTAPTSTRGWPCASPPWPRNTAPRRAGGPRRLPHAGPRRRVPGRRGAAAPGHPAAVRAALQGVAREHAGDLPGQRLRHEAHGRGAVPAPGQPVLPAAAHRGPHRHDAQERHDRLSLHASLKLARLLGLHPALRRRTTRLPTSAG